MSQKGIIKNSLTKDISALEWASIFRALWGMSGIVTIYNNLACTIVNNNMVELADGMYNLTGYPLIVENGTILDLAVDSGTAGQNRNDMVVAEFVRDGGGTGIDTLQFKIVKGTPTSGTPTDPTLTQEDINAAGVTRQEGIWRVKIVGTTITAVERVASYIGGYPISAYWLDGVAHVPVLKASSIMEIGKNLDFHTGELAVDYDMRITANGMNMKVAFNDEGLYRAVLDESNTIIDGGYVSITPSAANTPTSVLITFEKNFQGNSPWLGATADSVVAGTEVTGVAIHPESATQARVWVTRTNTTPTVVRWTAMWQNPAIFM